MATRVDATGPHYRVLPARPARRLGIRRRRSCRPPAPCRRRSTRQPAGRARIRPCCCPRPQSGSRPSTRIPTTGRCQPAR
ncbi:MAG: hypothetical protein F4102_08565, partial [Chloroflexi bacterium]|nr:hypothetical protein [Chloroflexota bacterium]